MKEAAKVSGDLISLARLRRAMLDVSRYLGSWGYPQSFPRRIVMPM